jgi:hypothetical protein
VAGIGAGTIARPDVDDVSSGEEPELTAVTLDLASAVSRLSSAELAPPPPQADRTAVVNM